MGGQEFKRGEYVVYLNGDRCEIGRIKGTGERGSYVAYHEGETGALTPNGSLFKIRNAHTIKKTTLGGEFFED